MFGYQIGRHKILHRMTASIPWLQSALNFFLTSLKTIILKNKPTYIFGEYLFYHLVYRHSTLLTHRVTTRMLQLGYCKVQRDETLMVGASWNVMAHAQKPDFVFRRNRRGHLNRRGPQFSQLLAAVVCSSAVVMLDTPCSEVVWKILATHFIRQFPLHFPSRASPCAITFQLDSTKM
jgi:hypothetical protein